MNRTFVMKTHVVRVIDKTISIATLQHVYDADFPTQAAAVACARHIRNCGMAMTPEAIEAVVSEFIV